MLICECGKKKQKKNNKNKNKGQEDNKYRKRTEYWRKTKIMRYPCGYGNYDSLGLREGHLKPMRKEKMKEEGERAIITRNCFALIWFFFFSLLFFGACSSNVPTP